MAFRFYQQLAWPDGVDALIEFWDGLRTGAVPPRSPASALRAWGRDCFEEERLGAKRPFARRELHLLLLFRMFALHVQGDRIQGKVPWAYGMPMLMPFHPDGDETALKNVRAALAELDREADYVVTR